MTNNPTPPERPPQIPNPIAQRTQPKITEPDPDFEAMKEKGGANILNSLLKKPLSVVYELNKSPSSMLGTLCLINLVCLGVFGFVLGLFSAGDQLWAAPVKVIGGVFFSGMICLPSLYIFGALGGMDAKFPSVAGLMLTFLAITSLLLVGFAPVVWLFSTSSNSLVFFGFLSLAIWMVCLLFGMRVISRASRSMGGGNGGHLAIWAIIFATVTLQMTTSLRPIIGKSDKFLNLKEKRFFLGYCFEVIEDESTSPHRDIPDEESGRSTDY